jgi:hypothetical protein
VCLTAERLQAINKTGKLQLKVMSDDTAEVFINGKSVYIDPVKEHNPK